MTEKPVHEPVAVVLNPGRQAVVVIAGDRHVPDVAGDIDEPAVPGHAPVGEVALEEPRRGQRLEDFPPPVQDLDLEPRGDAQDVGEPLHVSIGRQLVEHHLHQRGPRLGEGRDEDVIRPGYVLLMETDPEAQPLPQRRDQPEG